MFNIKYLIRLDDACPTMDRVKWGRIEEILDHHGIRPMVGVIPQNEDPKQEIDSVDTEFWNKVHQWEKKGWAIALHGYNHCYSSDGGLMGLNPMWSRSEFAGLPLEEQRAKIRKGVAIMRENGINPQYFFAPSHTFDENTLNALLEESNIRIISDTIATKPYRYKDFVIIPQFGGQCREIKLRGLFTFCFHPNTMNEVAFRRVDVFLSNHCDEFISFEDVDVEHIGSKILFDRILSWGYFTMRRIKRLK